MKKIITPQQHGLMDYGLAAANAVVPRMLGADGKTQAVFAAFGATQGAVNAMSEQPYSVAKVIPWKVHGIIDMSTLPIFVLAPLLAGVHKQPRVRMYWIGAAVLLLTASLLTDWEARSAAK